MLKNPKKVRKWKTANANLLFGWHVDLYMAEQQKRENERAADGSIPLLGNQLAETPKQEAEKQIGCLDNCLLLLLWHVVLLQLWTTPKTTKANANSLINHLFGQDKCSKNQKR